ncbi:cupin domain protein [Niveomyces insectorum RCEF 264]|uniref:Cupin domain protein n=1 Tax=Niveomyces insectorum RCEF 264 TaxID=1081102 RepID=A0A162IF71_9HYPO|nr:cupin domain protein [Niveomyces insectorum RCEF 264]
MAAQPKETQPRVREDIKLLYDYKLKNAPGKSVVGVEVQFPPGGSTPPHRHGGATVVVTVTDGEVLSGMNGNAPVVYGVGETFMELPGCHHTVAENNSQEKPATFTAVFIVDTAVVELGYDRLTVLDDEKD